MFNLHQAITEWRRQMAACGIKSSEVLDELESHLRDDIEMQMRSGLDPQPAFEAAVQRIGQTNALTAEFKKIGGRKWAWLRKLKSLVARPAVCFPSLSDFNPTTREALELARAEAGGLHHDFIGTEHVLLGLLKSESGPLSNVLRRLGLDHGAIRAEIEKIVGVGNSSEQTAAIPYTPRARRALHLATSEAKALKQDHAGAEHVFLGLLLEGSGVAALVLKNFGVQVQGARQEVWRELDL
jgi:hypothetical protein